MRRTNRSRLILGGSLIVCGLLMLAVPGCKKAAPPAAQAVDLSIVAAHTTGIISRESPIRVRFTEDIADSSQFNIALDHAPFAFTPKVSGIALWSDSRMLEFRPRDRLPGGVQYTADVNLADIVETAPGQEIFRFEFATMRQSFEITVKGLESAAREDGAEQKLSGDLVTADVENDADIQELVTASQQGRDLPVSWLHHENRREHAFLVEGITRADTPSEVTLRWDGGPIGVDKKGEEVVAVPALSTFSVLQARAVQEEEEYVEIRFSDPLDARQNLRGLVQIDQRADLRFTTEGNILRAYSATPWAGTATVRINPGIRNARGTRLPSGSILEVVFREVLPQVRFSGQGVILPTSQGLTIPIETINLRAVIVRATRVYETNIPQFLQVNTLEDNLELNRVGRIIYEKTIPLGYTPDQKNRWIRRGLDVTPLLEAHPDGLFRIHLTFRRPHIIYRCPDGAGEAIPEADDEASVSWDAEQESSYWDAWETGGGFSDYYENRMNPCHPAFYRGYYDHDINVFRNILVSDLGLLAKRGGDGSVFVAVTDIKTTEPLAGIDLTLLDYQHQVLDTGRSGDDGTALLASERSPYLLVARSSLHTGYLKLDDGSSLSLSQFDVAGTTVTKGLKGFLYGERGVWRPGDPLHLTFILLDEDGRLPDNYPVRFELRNPRGQLVETLTHTQPLNGFYTFTIATDPDAPTGNWNARVKAGGAVFQKTLKIETVMPNRLKIALDFGRDIESLRGGKVEGALSAAWLHGAVARSLKAGIELTLTQARTRFPRYDEYVFDDPVRTFAPESQTILDGALDATGNTRFAADVRVENVSPGMLTATFTTRVFEPGGAFSIDRMSLPYHPFERYIGIRTPKGDKARGMLLTDTPHPVQIVALDPQGEPMPGGQVTLELYKIKWRWWWERGRESLADYLGTQEFRPIRTETVDLADGTGTWEFEIKYPDWGRYLIRATDRKGRHITGKILYIDWPGWAGRAQKDMPGGATALSFAADKEEYTVGENVVLTIPTGSKGRGLVSLESGTRVLRTAWIETGEEAARFEFTAAPEMAPNIYAHVTLLQPHLQAGNDLPIRMYGVIPIKILDPGTRLDPVIEASEVFRPEEQARITIREQNGKPMTYTLAVVDEGLLDLTRFATPDAWAHFYQREALGVKTWDLFDEIAGAYGGRLEELLAIGGGEAAGPVGQKRATRFPPLVRFLGPFALEAGREGVHELDIPQYVGSVRIMVTAGEGRAFGLADQAVFVRKPLMILGTLPRVLGPEEEVDLPVAVFALEDKVRDVAVGVEAQGPVTVVGPARREITFAEPGEDLVTFRLKARAQTGVASVSLSASGGGERAGHRIEFDIRMPSRRVTSVTSRTLDPGASWQEEVELTGLPGTNQATLEVSRIPPLDLARRLRFLIRYPHGCVEQITSSVFPQLYLNKLLELSPDQQDEIQTNITAAIDRLRLFQGVNGGFLYWPGASEAQEWATNYAGHFLVEARTVGYLIPPGVLDQWTAFQRGKALAWTRGERRSELIQAYRLFTLALAGAAELGAMNRLKEMPDLPAEARWRLAAAFELAGQPEAARDLVRNTTTAVSEYRELSHTFGSTLRDKAMVLETLVILDMMDKAFPLAQEISEALSSERWLSTQATACALIAMARTSAAQEGEMRFAYAWPEGQETAMTSGLPLIQAELPVPGIEGGTLSIRNSGGVTLYARLILEGAPRPGSEQATQNNVALRVRYLTLDKKELDPTALDQGTDFLAEVTVTNTGVQGEYREVALSHLVPSGWEIRNLRMAPSGLMEDSRFDYQDIRDDRVYTYFDLKQGESRTFHLLLNAAYLGRYYLPFIGVEAMYDATISALVPGRWITVQNPGETR